MNEPSDRVLKPLKKGRFIFEGIQEGEDGEKRTMIFNPPLTINYQIFEKKDKETDKDNFNEDTPLLGYMSYDFGLTMATPIDIKNSSLLGYEGLTEKSDVVDILMKIAIFDLFHSFCHIDINSSGYTHYNWALVGWLKDRVIVKEC